MTLTTIANHLADVFIVVLVIGIPAIWAALPRRSVELTRAFRMMFAAFSFIMFRAAATRLDLWHLFGIPAWVNAATAVLVYSFTIAAVPRCVVASYKARLASEATLVKLADSTALLAEQTREAARKVALVVSEHEAKIDAANAEE